MIFKNSMKQMFRTPLKTLLFFLLAATSTLLFVLGINLFWMNLKDTAKFEKMFTTIGVAEQVPKDTELVGIWDAEEKRYYYRSKSSYGETVDPSALDFDGANYIIKPEKRPYFMSYAPQYNWSNRSDAVSRSQFMLVEITPLETRTINPIPIRVNRVLTENSELQGKIIWLCDHHNDNPDTLEAGKTYIMQIYSGGFQHDTNGAYYDEDIPWEWMPFPRDSTQYNEEGECIGAQLGSILYDEVTDGFYETERGKQWLDLLVASTVMDSIIPVQPAVSTDMLLPFHDRKAYFTSGRDISEEEYANGEKVCLMSRLMALYNELEVGDNIELPLYYANYANSLGCNFLKYGASFSFSFINAKGQMYEPFETDTYKIVGIFNTDIDDASEFGINDHEIIIPYNSVTNSWENNIVDDGPMKPGTTMFQIPNGTIDSYMEKWNALGIDNVKITFYDGGYSQLQEGVENRRMMSYILLIGGGITSVLIMLLFCHLFITRQEERTAIERSLGMSRRQSTHSMLSGILVIVSASVILGSVTGWYATGKTVDKLKSEQIYDTAYTNGQPEIDEDEIKALFDYHSSDAVGSAVLGGALLLMISMGIAQIYMRGNLKKEPIRLLTGSDE